MSLFDVCFQSKKEEKRVDIIMVGVEVGGAPCTAEMFPSLGLDTEPCGSCKDGEGHKATFDLHGASDASGEIAADDPRWDTIEEKGRSKLGHDTVKCLNCIDAAEVEIAEDWLAEALINEQ